MKLFERTDESDVLRYEGYGFPWFTAKLQLMLQKLNLATDRKSSQTIELDGDGWRLDFEGEEDGIVKVSLYTDRSYSQLEAGHLTVEVNGNAMNIMDGHNGMLSVIL